jgi:GMP synthase-like glutamine amidotransferase
MKICFFQHDSLENPGYILEWAKDRGHETSFVNFYEDPALPEIKLIDALVIMGGPMNVGDEADEYSWLEAEGEFIKEFIRSGRKTLGICLGSQMIADAMGAKVYRNHHTEIGWHNVIVDQAKVPDKFMEVFPDEFMTFHWHGYTFEIPECCDGFIRSEATRNQAFIHGNVAAFQFHPEITKQGVLKLVEKHEDVFDKIYPFIQSRNEIVETDHHFELNRTLLFKFLDRFFDQER